MLVEGRGNDQLATDIAQQATGKDIGPPLGIVIGQDKHLLLGLGQVEQGNLPPPTRAASPAFIGNSCRSQISIQSFMVLSLGR
jgi:hypothetical protein